MYVPGDFLFSKESGVGHVLSVQNSDGSEVEIEFSGRSPEVFNERLLNRSTTRLSPGGFRVFSYLDPEGAAALLQDDPIEAICRVMEDFPGYRVKTDELKEYLSPYMVDWDAWWEKVQPKLKESPRIDSTNSKLREYGLHRELTSQAEEAYLAFHRLRAFESAEVVFDRAKDALAKLHMPNDLPAEHADDLINYFRQVVASDKYSISTRIDSLYRLEDENRISKKEFRDNLVNILINPFRIYELDSYPATNLIETLIKQPCAESELELLSSSICAGDSQARKISEWAIRRGDQKFLGRLIIVAFTENLPPIFPIDKLLSLKSRIELCTQLIHYLPKKYPNWIDIREGYRQLVKSIAFVNLEEVRILVPKIVILAENIVRQSANEEAQKHLFGALVDPDYPIHFVVSVIDWAERSKLPKTDANILEHLFWDNAEKRQDDYLKPFIVRWTADPIQQVSKLVKVLESNKSITLSQKASKVVNEICQQADGDQLIDLLPALDKLYWMSRENDQISSMEVFREKAYLLLLNDARSRLTEPFSHPLREDRALTAAVDQYIDQKTSDLQLELNRKEQILVENEKQIQKLQTLISEKDTILRELKGIAGGDTREARFEERSRILKNLVGSVAEFDRFAEGLTQRSRELDAVLKRLSAILNSENVIQMEKVGSVVQFDPQKHRLIESVHESQIKTVIVVERGYLIRDHREQLRLLKPALVKMA